MQLSPWSFALAGGPAAEGGYPAGGRRRSDEVVAFDQENYAWEARWVFGGQKLLLLLVLSRESGRCQKQKKGENI